MTDVEITVEDCAHVITPHEAIALAKTARELAEDALREDAVKPDFIIERGLITKENVGSVAAELYPFGSRSCKTNTTRLWNEMITLDKKNWSNVGPDQFKFTVSCFMCGAALGQCKRHHYEQILAVPVNELFGNAYHFRAASPAAATLYRRLLERVNVLTTI